MTVHWSREELDRALATFQEHLEDAAAAAMDLNRVAWADTGDPTQPRGDWEGYALGMFDAPDHEEDMWRRAQQLRDALPSANDAGLAEGYDVAGQMEVQLRQIATSAIPLATHGSLTHDEGVAAESATRKSQADALRVILGYGDVRRNERRSAA